MTKNNPSLEYYKNLDFYKDMHENGYSLIDGRKRNSKDAYDGKSTKVFAPIIKKIITKENIGNMIDYGCNLIKKKAVFKTAFIETKFDLH